MVINYYASLHISPMHTTRRRRFVFFCFFGRVFDISASVLLSSSLLWVGSLLTNNLSKSSSISIKRPLLLYEEREKVCMSDPSPPFFFFLK